MFNQVYSYYEEQHIPKLALAKISKHPLIGLLPVQITQALHVTIQSLIMSSKPTSEGWATANSEKSLTLRVTGHAIMYWYGRTAIAALSIWVVKSPPD